MNQTEIGTCDICHNADQPLQRHYYNYPFLECECHSPHHFEIVSVCPNCEAKEPATTRVHISTDVLQHLWECLEQAGIDSTIVKHNRIRLLQYDNLRHHFNKLTRLILGDDYYNEGQDVYLCDRLTCDDIFREYVDIRFKYTTRWSIRAFFSWLKDCCAYIFRRR